MQLDFGTFLRCVCVCVNIKRFICCYYSLKLTPEDHNIINNSSLDIINLVLKTEISVYRINIFQGDFDSMICELLSFPYCLFLLISFAYQLT
jgi:hypothetical protein